MKKVARREGRGEEPLLVGLKTFVQRELREFVISAGMTALTALLEVERTQVCGERYVHLAERRAHRGGHTQGELVLGGRRVGVRRPRAHTLGGEEVTLPSWKAFSNKDPWTSGRWSRWCSGCRRGATTGRSRKSGLG